MSAVDRLLTAGSSGSSCGSYPPLLRYTCDPMGTVNAFMSWLSHTLWSLIQVWWPLLILAAVMALPAGALLARVARQRRERETQGARFWEITPPYELPADGAAPLWRLLASQLAEYRRHTRVALEMWADADGRLHAGMWVPGGVSAYPLCQAVERAWYGCGLIAASPPNLPGGPVAARELVPAEGVWAPLVDHQYRAEPGVADFADEPLRAVLDGISTIASSGAFASMQVIVSPARGTRIGATLSGRTVADVIAGGLTLLAKGVLAFIEVFLPGPSSQSTSHHGQAATAAQDPVKAARQRALQAKQKSGPHLRATVRLSVAGTGTPSLARRWARELAGALAALAVDEHVTARKRVRRALSKVDEYRHGRSFIASTRELAALWHLPDNPARHGLPQPGVDRRKPDTGLPRLDDYRHRQQSRDQQAGDRHRQQSRDQQAGDRHRDPARRDGQRRGGGHHVA